MFHAEPVNRPVRRGWPVVVCTRNRAVHGTKKLKPRDRVGQFVAGRQVERNAVNPVGLQFCSEHLRQIAEVCLGKPDTGRPRRLPFARWIPGRIAVHADQHPVLAEAEPPPPGHAPGRQACHRPSRPPDMERANGALGPRARACVPTAQSWKFVNAGFFRQRRRLEDTRLQVPAQGIFWLFRQPYASDAQRCFIGRDHARNTEVGLDALPVFASNGRRARGRSINASILSARSCVSP